MPADYYIDILLCVVLATLGWAWIFGLRRALKSQWIQVVAIGLVNGFLAFILYLFFHRIAPRVGIPASSWLTLPSVVVTVSFFYGMLSIKR